MMINSRLYNDLEKLMEGTLTFSYYTAEIDIDTSKLKSYTININQDEVLSTLNEIGIKNLLFNINEAEFSRFTAEFKELKEYIDELSQTDIYAANVEIAKLWGPNELQRKFTEWFDKNGHSLPHKPRFTNIKKTTYNYYNSI